MTSRVKDLKKNNEDFQTLEKKHTWIQSTVSKAFSEIFFRVGAINICSKNSIYPYMCEYNTDNFELTEKFKLTPIFKNYLNS